MSLLQLIFPKTVFKTHTNCEHLRAFCIASRDVLNTSTNNQQQTDILTNTLKNVKTVNTVLEMVNIHNKSMNHKHLVQALKVVFNLQKGGNSDLSTHQITKNPHFERLCRSLKYQAGALQVNEAIESLKVLSFLGIQADSVIMQTLLQIIRHKINELTLQQIIFLEFLLKQFKSTPLVEALKIAVPLVFEIQLPYQVDKDNVKALCDYFQYASTNSVSSKCIEYLCSSLLTTENSFDTKIASSIAWSICDLDADVFFEPLLLKSLDFLVLNVYSMKFGDLETTLSKLSKKFSTKTPFYYHEIFFDVCANLVTEKDLGFHYAVYILRKFFKVGHLSMNLLNYVSLKALEDPQLIHDPIFFNDVATAMAVTDERPIHWDNLSQMLQTMPITSVGNQGDIMWMKIAVSLISIGVYREDVIQKACGEKYLTKLLRNAFQFDLDQLLILNQVISTYKPEFERLLPSPTFLNNSMSKLKWMHGFPLEASLKFAFGGDKFVATKLLSRLGHKIDHVIALNSYGDPIPIKNYIAQSLDSDSFLRIEDIKFPTNVKIIPILCLSWVNYSINCQRLRAPIAMMIRTLKARGYNVVTINLDNWYALEDFEKITYLKQAVEEQARITNQADIVDR